MTYSDIQGRIRFTGAEDSSAFANMASAAIASIYSGSPLAAAAIDAWLVANPDRNLEIEYVPGTAEAVPGSSGHVRIDPAFFDNNYYISIHGQAVRDTFISGLTHEISHAVVGLTDNESFFNLYGENVLNANDWFQQLGLSEQSSYEAYDKGDALLKPGYDYTQDHPIDNAIIDRQSYHSYDNSLQFDSSNINLTAEGVLGPTLIVGSDLDNNYTGTTSSDWIYGADGNDTLDGGVGDDHLYSGYGTDQIAGGDGDDVIQVGEARHLELSTDSSVDGGAGADWIVISRAATRHTTDEAAQIHLAQGDAGDHIVWNGHELSGGQFEVLNDPEPDEEGLWTQIGITGYVGPLGEVYNLGSDSLKIILPDNSVLDMPFQNGQYGLTFADAPESPFDASILRTNNAHDHPGGFILDFNLLYSGIDGREEAFNQPGLIG